MNETKAAKETQGEIWMDGHFVPWDEAKVHMLTHGLHYASSVFEGSRAYGGVIFREAEHTARLFRSAQILDMTPPFSQAQISQAQNELLARNGLTDAYLRPVVFRGISHAQMSLSGQKCPVHVMIATWVWPSYFSSEREMQGIRLAEALYRRPPANAAPYQAKAAGLYMICTLSKHRAEADGYQDALMLDAQGHIAEATGANVFFIKDGTLHTPIPDSFLNGITRQEAIKLARRRGINVVERKIAPEEMQEFSACFLTGTAAEITPVSSIGSTRFTVDTITRTLVEDYHALVHGRIEV